jgi:hypothetical protein
MSERRQLQRHPVRVPVTLEHGSGITRDISVGGIYFETAETVVPGSVLLFSIELASLRETGMAACCEAEVLRTEARDEENIGVAARITSISFDSFPRWLHRRLPPAERSH